MDHDELGYTDFIAMDARQPSPSHDVARTLDLAALAEAQRADAEAFRLV